MDSAALPFFFALVSGVFFLFCFAAVFTSAAAIRVTAATLSLPMVRWRKLLAAGLLCGGSCVALFIAFQSETIRSLGLVWQTVTGLALVSLAVVREYLQDLFTTTLFRSLLLAVLALTAFAGTCVVGVAAATLLLRQM